MRREDFEHVIAAAAEVAGEDEIVVIGSQAILGSYPEAPGELLASMEVDLYPAKDPEKAEAIDGALGDGSPFQRTYGYYAHGVGPETARAPAGWEDRLVAVPIPARPGQRRGAVALCLEPHDLVLSKCAAGRERDWAFVKAALRNGLVDYAELQRRLADLSDRDEEARIRKMLTGIASSLGLDRKDTPG